MGSSVLICIFNYKHDENARRWLNLLSPHFETYVLDSGNSNKIDDFVQYPNIYYSGLFNETKKLAEKKKYSWIGIICSDVTIQDDQKELFINCIYWLTTTTNVGIWQAGPSKTSRSVHGHISNDGDYQYKKYIEGWMQFARADIINEIPYINLKENKYGWNIDSVCEIMAYYKKLSVLMDNRCEVYHPAERGYAETPARKEGKEWENKTLTKLHMRRIREATIEYVFKVQVNVTAGPMPTNKQNQNVDPTKSDNKSNNGKQNANKQISAKDIKKIGRNDPCPCGSGKKYKKCCGANL